jgi:hypothetical protein
MRASSFAGGGAPMYSRACCATVDPVPVAPPICAAFPSGPESLSDGDSGADTTVGGAWKSFATCLRMASWCDAADWPPSTLALRTLSGSAECGNAPESVFALPLRDSLEERLSVSPPLSALSFCLPSISVSRTVDSRCVRFAALACALLPACGSPAIASTLPEFAGVRLALEGDLSESCLELLPRSCDCLCTCSSASTSCTSEVGRVPGIEPPAPQLGGHAVARGANTLGACSCT